VPESSSITWMILDRSSYSTMYLSGPFKAVSRRSVLTCILSCLSKTPFSDTNAVVSAPTHDLSLLLFSGSLTMDACQIRIRNQAVISGGHYIDWLIIALARTTFAFLSVARSTSA